MTIYKILGLDVGTKRIGIAISDALRISVRGLKAVDRTPELDAINEIKKIAEENDIKKIVVGVPYNMDGSKGSQAQDCIDFASKLNDFEIIFEDERLTSELAVENLKNRKINFRKNKSLVDIESACIILEQYIKK
jgi:putative holliday junction resolvase